MEEVDLATREGRYRYFWLAQSNTKETPSGFYSLLQTAMWLSILADSVPEMEAWSTIKDITYRRYTEAQRTAQELERDWWERNLPWWLRWLRYLA